MFERDYIKRLIQQFAQVVEKIILHKKQQDWPQVQMVIDVSAKQLLGLNPDLIESMDSKALISMFKISNEMDYEKCFILGRLLQEQAFIYENTKENENKIYKTYLKSYNLFSKAIENDELRNKENIKTILGCCNSLQQFRLEDNILLNIFNFYRDESHYAEAENILFLLLKSDAENIRSLAREFYSGLLLLKDFELNKANLPREEVLEGLKNLDTTNGDNH